MTRSLAAVFLAETRTTRRLARTWVLGVLAVGTTLIGYVYFSGLHAEMSAFLPSAVTSPRFLVASFGGYLLWFLLAATVFLGFDIGSRERRERIADVLDARPVSNLELLAGRLGGVIATLAVPIAITVALFQGIGALGQLFDWILQASVEPVSLALFLTIDALPALVLWCAIVFLLAAALRNRFVVAVVALALLGLANWGLSQAPAWLLQTVALAPDRLVSDLVAPLPDVPTLTHRLGMVSAAAGVLVLGALCLRRPDTLPRLKGLFAATVFIAGGASGVGWAVLDAHAELEDRARWHTAQTAAAGTSADIVEATGAVRIDPGTTLDIDVTLTVAVDAAASNLVLRFNPGMSTREVLLDGQKVRFEHRDGLLRLDLPARGDTVLALTVRADGVPDPDFAYLDSAFDYRHVVGANPLRDLGTEAGLFDRRYVALMPGVHWLPGAVATPRSPPDFTTIDLTVQVPADWLVAGPGAGVDLGNGRFRFAPAWPVPEFALITAKFERVATTVDDIQLELLVSPGHTAPLGFFEDAAADIDDALAGIIRDAESWGLPYPYESLTMVEVPAPLRGYGGGWQMRSVLAMPGMLLLRERGLPTARFYDSSAPDGRFPTEKADRLRMYLRDDRSGADPLAGLARNLLLQQTGAHGPGAQALEYVCQALVARLLDNPDAYFSAHIYASSPSVSTLLAGAFTSVLIGGSGSASGEIYSADRSPVVWERALGTALAEIDVTEPAQAVNILTMKGDAVARSLLDALGRDTVAGILAELRTQYRGTHFTIDDFERIAASLGADLPGVLGDWLDDASLPGFVASPATNERLADGDDGEPRYQLRIHVFNGEDTPGLLRLQYRAEPDPVRESDPIRLAGRRAMEVGLVTRSPIQELWVAPYLSLNRHEFPVRVPEVDAAGVSESASFAGARPSTWRPAPGRGIVVDDLDPGFSADRPPPRPSSASRPDYATDEGFPVYQRRDPVIEAHWSRQEQPTSWGRYRHTIVRITPGDGGRAATFSTDLPEAGRWRIDYHLPNLAVGYTARIRSPYRLTANVEFGPGGNRGPAMRNYDLRLLSGGTEQPLEFDASVAEPGWTTLGQFDLGPGEVGLRVTNRTDGRTVVADAVRWTRVDSTAAEGRDGGGN